MPSESEPLQPITISIEAAYAMVAAQVENERDVSRALAQEVLDVLALQQEYFRTRDRGTLAQSKRAEAELKRHCQQVTGALIS